jgi:hypothetical protein
MEDLNRWVDFWAQCANFLVATGRRVSIDFFASRRQTDSLYRTGSTISTTARQSGARRVTSGGKDMCACASCGTLSSSTIPYMNNTYVRIRLLKFTTPILALQRTAYIQAFMEAVVTPRISVEHEYISKVLEVDHYQHPLLLGIDDVLGFGEGTVCLSKAELSRFALPIIESEFTSATGWPGWT